MKKITVLFGIVLFSTFSVFSQLFEGGLQIGLNATQIDGDELGGYNHPALLAGGFVEVSPKQGFHVELGLKYGGKGATQSLNRVPSGYSRTKVSLHYIEIPVIASQQFLRKYDVQIGLLGNYLFATKVIDGNGNIVDPALYDYSTFDVMGVVGLEVPYRKKLKLGLHFSNSIGFISDKPLLRNRVVSLSAKYFIARKT
ncbi:MAG: PorT family protein [Bacteroidales bacterium]|nr:PorT family protein [Bacteroidales bacterium]